MHAITHEYAQKPLDVLLRRTRLGFVDARAALGALPEVVRVMGDALSWDARRRREEAKRGEEVLRGMDAGGRVEIAAAPVAGEGWWGSMRVGELRRRLWSVFGCPAPVPVRLFSVAATYPRALFEPGEIEALREVFEQHARPPAGSGAVEEEQSMMPVSRIREAVRAVAGLGYAYDSVRESDFRYILREAELSDLPEGEMNGKGKRRDGLDFEEFVEVRPYFTSFVHFFVLVLTQLLAWSFLQFCRSVEI